jgi:hypothetical protein
MEVTESGKRSSLLGREINYASSKFKRTGPSLNNFAKKIYKYLEI